VSVKCPKKHIYEFTIKWKTPGGEKWGGMESSNIHMVEISYSLQFSSDNSCKKKQKEKKKGGRRRHRDRNPKYYTYV